jgi:hypothetical protein
LNRPLASAPLLSAFLITELVKLTAFGSPPRHLRLLRLLRLHIRSAQPLQWEQRLLPFLGRRAAWPRGGFPGLFLELHHV